MPTDPDTGSKDDAGPPRAAVLAAVALAVVAVGVILAIAAGREAPRRPVDVAAIPAPQAASPACRSLAAALPQRLGDYQRVPIAAPVPPGTYAWRASADVGPVVLRCGLARPGEFVVGTPIQVVDKVQWFEASAERQSAGDAGTFTWYTVDRPVYVALTLPSGSGPTPIQQLSDVIDHAMPAVPIDPAPAR
ncbi:hypothetical protein MSAS_53400 [Mycobacterium saskatchewanense]|uniref:DUF3515 domain-containing protein n=1 Tax=Mycobacterium saskatchewanense TaxID=220927 RepID=A0AAJ3NP57_9MYCO|nr:DUF3515 domain-containing protein [Mycobacterium saskatchewanense]ORW70974.1 hypothetical protein AWC23_15100 [Mycobacterium saskatchewanense]BBX66166.1 hypothetical protein MSAS_53400 [Mycobacterium saskatchewanense]